MIDITYIMYLYEFTYYYIEHGLQEDRSDTSPDQNKQETLYSRN